MAKQSKSWPTSKPEVWPLAKATLSGDGRTFAEIAKERAKPARKPRGAISKAKAVSPAPKRGRPPSKAPRADKGLPADA